MQMWFSQRKGSGRQVLPAGHSGSTVMWHESSQILVLPCLVPSGQLRPHTARLSKARHPWSSVQYVEQIGTPLM